ncbi:preprotein translocase subunit SecY [Blattabacterium cuenoti]|uniref:preprotein translocase subunit SecY n=1 Tax=Blattabacterium cuenoti TaxID=1653831 RepID=UPI00163C707E|nr:preprotein translocase subunit SecY [Blattabacterium cuenoti]
MNHLILAICNIWNAKNLRKKILITINLLLIYRFGAYIPLPGINPLEISNFLNNLHSGSKGLMQILSSFTGGAFNRASIFALGVMPYISASIIVQLMCIIIPSLNRLQKDGESGRKQINILTRWLTLAVCFIQAPFYLISLTKQFIPISSFYSSYLLNMNLLHDQILFWILGIIILTCGTIFTMWIGDRITENGIGNGISLIIMSGIIVRFPGAIIKELMIKLKDNDIIFGICIFIVEIVFLILVILFTIILIQAVRKIPIQYVSNYRTTSYYNTNLNIIHKKYQYLPLKMTAAGVMPIIFSQSIMLFPLFFYHYIHNENIKNIFHVFENIYGFWYNLFFTLFIIIFTFFYTAITIPVNQISYDLKRNGGHIPKVMPGKQTADYLDIILSRITFPGAVLLAIIAILPSIVCKLGITKNFSLFYGGTSLLIVVGVILDLIQQVNIYLLNYYYDDLMMLKSNRYNYSYSYK